MLKNFINIDNFKYYIEFDDSKNYRDQHRANYVMLRNFSLMNDVVCDDDLYFIEKNLYEQLKKQIQNKEDINCICFPGHNNHYSDHYSQFSDIMIDDDFLYDLSVYDIYEINDNKFELKYVKQNLIKIYHPHNIVNTNYIIHIENIINNINVHYICNLYKNFPINSKTEIRTNNNIYSEYIEVEIPDIRDLFGINFNTFDTDNNNTDILYTTYYRENLNSVGFTKDNFQENFIKQILKLGITNDDNTITVIDSDDASENQSLEQFIALAFLTQPFLLKQENDVYYKTYFKHNWAVSNNFMLAPITITMFPYDYVDKTNHIYMLSDTLRQGTCSFYYEYKFKLSSVCDFDENGNIALLTKFIYPNKEYFDEIYGNQNSLSKAYCYFNGITNLEQYNQAYDKLFELYQHELDDISYIDSDKFKGIPDYDKKIMIANNPMCLKMSDTELRKEYKRLKMESFLEEYIDTYKTDIDFFGFRIEIGTDVNFKNIVFAKNQSLSVSFLKSQELMNEQQKVNWDDCLNINIFAFNINGLFENWTQVTDTLIAKVYFIDRFIGFVIESNPIVITKEQFKYIINDDKHARLNYQNPNNYNNDNDINVNINTMKEYILNTRDKNGFNFINKLNCIVHNDTENNDKIIAHIKTIVNNNELDINNKLDAIKLALESNITSSTQLTSANNVVNTVYQPIFFSTHTTDNITITAHVTENIGIDLHEYINKVDEFKLRLNDKTFKQIGRTTNYVLFNINADNLTATSGTYHIYDGDNNYITKGSWIVTE